VTVVASMLSVHVAYRCRDSGACCTSGWPIPVEVPLHRTLEAAIASGRLRVASASPVPPFSNAPLPSEYAALLAMNPHGACVFHDGASHRCAIHSTLGAGAKPAACRAFPRIVVQDPRGTSVSLSHYCPSALDLLFVDPPPIRIVAVPDLDAPDALVEGLDARAGLPPALDADVLVDWESLGEWDAFVMAIFECATSPEQALDRLWQGYAALRPWRPGHGPLATLIARLERGPRDAAAGLAARPIDAVRLVEAVSCAIPSHLAGPLAAIATPNPDRKGLGGDRFARPLCRYLAARAFACWPLYQGCGLHTQLVYLEAALALVRAQTTHARARREATGDGAALREAIRWTDLLLVHHAEPESLARALDEIVRERSRQADR